MTPVHQNPRNRTEASRSRGALNPCGSHVSIVSKRNNTSPRTAQNELCCKDTVSAYSSGQSLTICMLSEEMCLFERQPKYILRGVAHGRLRCFQHTSAPDAAPQRPAVGRVLARPRRRHSRGWVSFSPSTRPPFRRQISYALSAIVLTSARSRPPWQEIQRIEFHRHVHLVKDLE